MRKTGTYQSIGDLNYFIPLPLPPVDPPLNLNEQILALYGEASFALGQLNEMSLRLPDPKRFIRAYVIKEALLSSAIEGLHTTLVDIFTHPLERDTISKETQLVLNYTQALETAVNMITTEGFPLVSRVILQAHKVLMSAGKGDHADPGNYRKQSVRVGSLVPPPAPEIPRLIADLEKYINSSSETLPLIAAGLAHVHFETIHPFLDGNGRIGRLLIVLMLIDRGLLNQPILYPSYYFKKHQLEYYQKLDLVRTAGDFEGWILYYLKAIKESCLDAYTRAKEIEDLEHKLTTLIEADDEFYKLRDTAVTALNYLFKNPITSAAVMSNEIKRSYNTTKNILKAFVSAGFVTENRINSRNKLYRFTDYIKLLEKELVIDSRIIN